MSRSCIYCGKSREDSGHEHFCKECLLTMTERQKEAALADFEKKKGVPKHKMILLVDDEESVQRVIGKRLEANGYDVVTAGNGEEAFNLLGELNPDLVVLDILMPRMTGYDLLQKMRKSYDRWNVTPVIIITAKGSMRDFFAETRLHAFMVKPFKPEELLDRVQELLKRAQDLGA